MNEKINFLRQMITDARIHLDKMQAMLGELEGQEGIRPGELHAGSWDNYCKEEEMSSE